MGTPLPPPASSVHSSTDADANPNLDPDTNPNTKPHPPHWLPLLSTRSLKFYDGTFRWDGGRGYWDDEGVYHVFNDEEDEEGRPPTPGPVGVWLLEDDGEKKGEEKRDGCEEKGVEMDEEKDSTPPVDMMADTTHPDTQDDDELPTVGDTQLGPHDANVTGRNPADSSPLSDCPSDLSDWNESHETQDSDSASGQKSEGETENSDACSEMDGRFFKGGKARGCSIDSGVDIPSKRRRSERIFLKQ